MATDADLISLEKKLLERQEKLEKEREELTRAEKHIAEKKEEYAEKLQKVSGLTSEEARAELLREIEEKEVQTLAKIIKEKPGLTINGYMGLVMKEFRGKISGKEASEIIKKYVK